MAYDYEDLGKQIEESNVKRIPDIVRDILSQLHAVRTHFIFELLQNAEDALTRHSTGSRRVEFHLTRKELHFRHFGKPFDKEDIKAICAIGESTKLPEFNVIGKFGIGFKSVYRYTRRPEIYSGADATFAIEDCVYPRPIDAPSVPVEPGETLILMPIKPDEPNAFDEIAVALEDLKPTTLLFLREIEEIHWKTEDGQGGSYVRKVKELSGGVRRVEIVSRRGGDVASEEWVVFSQTVDGDDHGLIEIAFSLKKNKKGRLHIQRIQESPLVVFFPTEKETHLGFLVQGRYVTNPSRETIPDNEWNRKLAGQTGKLLVEALEWLKDVGWLKVSALETLPLNAEHFEGRLLEPLFNSTKEALSERCLLPRHGGRFVSAENAFLGHTQKLREMFPAEMLSKIYSDKKEPAWISGDVTTDKAHELHEYLMNHLEIQEITVGKIVPLLDRDFFSAQSDEWMKKLYAFLNGYPNLIKSFKDVPLIRLENNEHVKASKKVFLPGDGPSEFDTVKSAVCDSDGSKESMKFLRALGLKKADLADDIVQNVLPVYKGGNGVSKDAHRENIDRILNAYKKTDNASQKNHLDAELKKSAFIPVVNAEGKSRGWRCPEEVYFPSEQLRFLFSGIEEVFFVDERYDYLMEKKVRKLMKRCGVSELLRVKERISTDWGELINLRVEMNWGTYRHDRYDVDKITDYEIGELEALLKQLPSLDVEQRQKKAKCLWAELIQLGKSKPHAFDKTFTCYYRNETRREVFHPKFVESLREGDWVTDENGDMRSPDLVSFKYLKSLGWEENSFLLGEISFASPRIEQVFEEKGVNERHRSFILQIMNADDEEKDKMMKVWKKMAMPAVNDQNEEGDVSETSGGEGESHERESEEGGGVSEEEGVEGEEVKSPSVPSSGGDSLRENSSSSGVAVSRGRSSSERGKASGSKSEKRAPFGPHIIGVHRQKEDSFGPGRAGPIESKEVEADAIALILAEETEWKTTPVGNPGYDLYKVDEQGNEVQWCEVKSTRGDWSLGPVSMSITQFKRALEKGDKFWLYVVERVGHDDARIFRIQNPAKYIDALAFDHSWADVAEDEPDEDKN
ncbi:MAG: DUF3883 domain-containing protein [Alphaproteobacteria bacterium]|nr:DUF3883 domain-containing protein [Alphaproteobacteria bacterium]MDA8003321.1 DUF3883 domain-containing protein [Alphaproteobacteria bacterium]MDA8005332.1 DUF3883 domain-containing protein [Alphaproteobacteria bacterium]MDA8012606.1 DUF3883 domain-containing protein [Alphaproteobacteria bacterium]